MSQSELLKRVVTALDAANVPYMLTGSYASSLQGNPRSTHDIDFVVHMSSTAAAALINAFPQTDYYLDEEAVRLAVGDKSHFNLIESATGQKVYFWLLTDEPFNQTRFSRRQIEQFEDARIFVSSPEDTIIMKLRWTDMLGGSEKQLADVRGVLQLQRNLDLAYIEEWVDRLGLAAHWKRVRN